MVKGSPNGLGMCDTDPSNKTPKQIAHYRIVAEIGRGGMGVVYEAEHAELGRRVALKVLPAHISTNEHAVKRFVREGKAIAQMHHSNIVPLFEVGEENGRFFLAMQLIDGRSLDHVIHDIADSPIKPLNSRQTERLFPQLAVESSASGLRLVKQFLINQLSNETLSFDCPHGIPGGGRSVLCSPARFHPSGCETIQSALG